MVQKITFYRTKERNIKIIIRIQCFITSSMIIFVWKFLNTEERKIECIGIQFIRTNLQKIYVKI